MHNQTLLCWPDDWGECELLTLTFELREPFTCFYYELYFHIDEENFVLCHYSISPGVACDFGKLCHGLAFIQSRFLYLLCGRLSKALQDYILKISHLYCQT